ncbi:MAG: YXWGXW repeat-containing protein [Deltaproteobacteria bacterium]|nr:YXWGXW repeat-containing protein [Deltaproteobacteria bacterium]
MDRRRVLQSLVSTCALIALPVSRVSAGGPKHKQKPHKGGGPKGGTPPGQARKAKYKVEVAPPAPVVERRPEAPSPRHIWVPGYWAWTNDRHVWVSGMWSMPPEQNVVWVAPQWVNETGSWLFFEGQWSVRLR